MKYRFCYLIKTKIWVVYEKRGGEEQSEWGLFFLKKEFFMGL